MICTKLKNIPAEWLCKCVKPHVTCILWVYVVFSLMSLARISGVEGRQRRGRFALLCTMWPTFLLS